MKNWFPKSWDFHINILVMLLSKIIIEKNLKVVGRVLRKEKNNNKKKY